MDKALERNFPPNNSSIKPNKPYYLTNSKAISVIKMVRKKPPIAVMGTKGQIVIPQKISTELKIIPKTKLAIYKNNRRILAKIENPKNTLTKTF